MGFYSGWSSRRGLYGGYGGRLSGGGSRTPQGRAATAGPARGDDLPEWVVLTYFTTGAVVFVGGLLVSAVWLWFETGSFDDGGFAGIMARLTIITLMLIPAAIACGIAAVVTGFGMVIVVGVVRGGIAVTRWARRRRRAEAAGVG